MRHAALVDLPTPEQRITVSGSVSTDLHTAVKKDKVNTSKYNNRNCNKIKGVFSLVFSLGVVGFTTS